MGKKKIDDVVLLEMIRSGKKQKDIAEHFGVTPAAVSKRLKRLLPVPKSFTALTEKEQKFVQGRVQGMSQTQAALEAYDVSSRESAKALGHTISKAPHVRQAIEDLMDYHGLSRSFRVKKVREHVDNPDPNVSLRALTISAGGSPTRYTFAIGRRCRPITFRGSRRCAARHNRQRHCTRYPPDHHLSPSSKFTYHYQCAPHQPGQNAGIFER